MKSGKKVIRVALAILCMVSMLFISEYQKVEVYAASGYGFIFLSAYEKTLKTGDTYCLSVVSSGSKKPTFTSSDSKVASVNTYGKITAKKAGSATITAKTKNAEASCKVTVTKTKVTLNKTSLILENGESAVLTAASSTGHKVTWKSAKTSIASVSENGKVTAKKPGTTTVTAKVDGTSVNCKVTVKSPTVRLMPSKISLYRREKYKLKVSSTSKTTPVWKTNKKSVATVDETGKVLLTGDMVADATKQVGAIQKGGNAQPYVALKFNDEGKQLFAEATAANIGKPIYIVMDGEVISAPMVQSAITTGEASITGNFTGESAEELASLIRAGSLPFNLNVIQMKNVGARLGADALATGVKAGAIGLALAGKKSTIVEMSDALASGPNTPYPGTGAMQLDALQTNIDKNHVNVMLNTK